MNIDLLDTIKDNSIKNSDYAKGISNYMNQNDVSEKGHVSKIGDKAYTVDSIAPQKQSPIYQHPGDEEKTMVEKLEDGDNLSASARKNRMAVLANTTTPQDLAKMEEEGFSVEDTSSHTIVTVTDQIKANMAKTGGEIEGELSKEQLEEITGSVYLATQLAQTFAENDIPDTEENRKDFDEAVNMAQAIQNFDEKNSLYLVKNQKLPTIENIYMAKHSAVMTQNISDVDVSELRPQIEDVIAQAKLPVNEETVQMAKTLLDNEIALTSDNLAYFDALKQVTKQTESTEYIENAIVTAIEEGGRPKDAMMLPGYSIKDQAKQEVDALLSVSDEDIAYCLENEKEINLTNLTEAQSHRGEADVSKWEKELSFITARRVLEETRLEMTTEANYALLKKGVAIDTKPLVELVEELKNTEKNYYENLLKQYDIEPTEERVSILSDTTELLSQLKSAPATVLSIGEADTLFGLSEKATAQKISYEKAGEEYEKLWTAPRADMGDSIKKAFRNVDDILTDMNLSTTDENRRAVRILAYNQTEITEENITAIKAKDMEMQRAFSTLTPRTTIEMIRRNQNPLDMEITELARAAEEISTEIGDDGREKFSRYLYKLEQNSAISEEERSAYIGIYRLIAQVEKNDGAALGAALNQGSEITMRSLLTQIRNSSHKNKDYVVDDDFDGVDSTSKGPKIDRQIQAAFQNNCVKEATNLLTPDRVATLMEYGNGADEWMEMTPEELHQALAQADTSEAEQYSEELYNKELATQLLEAANADEEIYKYLDRMEMKDTTGNILALNQMMSHPGSAVSALWKSKNMIRELKDELMERFGENLKKPQELADAMETLAEVAEHCMDNMIIEDPDVSSVDVKAMKLVSKQMTIAAKRTEEENFVIPMETGEGVTGVSLKVVRGSKDKGFVDIMFESSSMGKVAASFEAKNGGISGLLITDDEATRQLFADNLSALAQMLSEENEEAVDLQAAVSKDLSLENFSLKNLNRVSEGESDDREVQTSRLYGIAKSFIEFVSDFHSVF